MKESGLHIVSLEVWNFGGLDHFKAELGQASVIQGANGEGKTTLLRALDSVFSGGHDPATIRNFGTPEAAEKAEVFLELSNGATIKKTITPKESKLEVRSPDGGLVRGPATFLQELCPSTSFDPIGFLNSDTKDRAAFLLKFIPLAFDSAEISKILSSPISGAVNLQRFNELRDAKYEERRALNVRVRDLEGTIEDMRKSLPSDEPRDWGAERDQIQAEISQIDVEVGRIQSDIALEAEQRVGEKRSEIQQKVAALQKELADFESKVERVKTETIAEQTKELAERKAALSLSLGAARERADREQQVVGIRQAIEDRKEALKGHVTDEMRMTAQLKSMDALKNQKLKELPIPGLDIKADAKGRPILLIDGIPLDKLNRQRQLFVAIQCVSKAAGRLPLILCEVAELDDASLAELTEAAKDSGLQLIVARWENDAPLKVSAA